MNRTFVRALCLFALLVAPLFADIDLTPFQDYVNVNVPGARIGISVRSVKTGAELSNIRGDKFFTPASTLKTLTTSTALHVLPLDYEPKTKLSLDGSVHKNTFVGRLLIRGEGDPNISGRYYADPFYILNAMADSIRALGIDTIRGRIDLDSSYYKGPWKADHWRKNFYDAWYGAEIAPLGFNDNCTMVRFKPGEMEGDRAIVTIVPDIGYVTVVNDLFTVSGKKKKWTYGLDPDASVITLGGTIGINVDSVSLVLPIRNPINYFRAALFHAFRERGLSFIENKSVGVGYEIKKFEFSAAPLLSMLDEINQRSQNFHAETLLRNVGAEYAGVGSVENGWKAECKFLSDMNIKSSDFEVWDGSGLSPKNKVKPSAETELLAKMARHPKGRFFVNSLASPGVGSGSKRMQDLETPWLTRFKTGFIAEVYALVGYIFPLDGDTLAVAMYLNETGTNNDQKCKGTLDTLWTHLIAMTNDKYNSLMEMKSLWLSAQKVRRLYSRLDYFSKALIGKPYKLGPTGESYLDYVDKKPLLNMDSVDCMTYVEHTLAMALAPHEDSLFSVLRRIRYKNGKVGFLTRKHYMIDDWVGEGKFAKIIPMEGDVVETRTMPKVDFFKSHGLRYVVDGVESADKPMKLRYLPYNKACRWAGEIYRGPMMVVGIGFVGKSEKIDVTHTGFVILRPGKYPVLRHASSARGMVVEVPLDEYLARRKIPGITLFEFRNSK